MSSIASGLESRVYSLETVYKVSLTHIAVSLQWDLPLYQKQITFLWIPNHENERGKVQGCTASWTRDSCIDKPFSKVTPMIVPHREVLHIGKSLKQFIFIV